VTTQSVIPQATEAEGLRNIKTDAEDGLCVQRLKRVYSIIAAINDAMLRSDNDD
jgi:hypothetical protein